jgi:ubiquinone/menaquinone biosynthesis C-methylase UbiE
MSTPSHTHPLTPSSASEDIYTFGYSPAAIEMLAGRTAQEQARFFLPYVRPGMHLLDCGCGPGSITIGLAAAVAPGEVVGVDLEPSQVTLAQARAAACGVANVRVVLGDIRAIPVPEATFDAAFGHTIVMSFRDPIPALREVYRVVKPGGVVGFRELDFSGRLYEPPEAAWQEFWDLYARVVQHNGGSVQVGKRLGGLLRRAGFDRITMSASYQCAGTPEQRRLVSEVTARLCEEAAFMEQAVALGWAQPGARQRLSAALRAEGERDEGFFAAAFCEVVGWKGGRTTP